MRQYTPDELQQVSPLVLAYIGDGVYELAVRQHLLEQGLMKAGALHSETIRYVNAERQSQLLGDIEGLLTEQELAVFRRGRNAKSSHQPSHARVVDYRRATGIEALIGWLYLTGQEGRLQAIFEQLFAKEM